MVDAGYRVGFDQSTCYISKAGMETELGTRTGSLYFLNMGKESALFEADTPDMVSLGLAVNQSPSATLETWHQRLGHRTLDSTSVRYIPSKVMNMMVSKESIPSTKICPVCALGRQHKEGTTKEPEKATERLSVVHSDICRPMQTPSLNGERYLITFTDEKSASISITRLNKKYGALASFQAYRSRTEKASARTIKTLRTDRGKEYLNIEFRKHLVGAGIQDIVSPPYSPKRNCMAE